MKPAKTQPTPEERCCPKCRSVEFWVTTEGIPRQLSSGATVHNQDYLECRTCGYECTGLVFSATLAKRRKVSAPVPNAEITKALDALLDAQPDWPSVAPEASAVGDHVSNPVEFWVDGKLVGTAEVVAVNREAPAGTSGDDDWGMFKRHTETDQLWLSGGRTSVGNLVRAYHQQPAPKPTFKHGKKRNHRCVKATQKKARRKSR